MRTPADSMCLACVGDIFHRFHHRSDPDRRQLSDLHMVDCGLLFLRHNRRFRRSRFGHDPNLPCRDGRIPCLWLGPHYLFRQQSGLLCQWGQGSRISWIHSIVYGDGTLPFAHSATKLLAFLQSNLALMLTTQIDCLDLLFRLRTLGRAQGLPGLLRTVQGLTYDEPTDHGHIRGPA